MGTTGAKCIVSVRKKVCLGEKKSLKITKNVLRSRKSKKIQWSKEKGQKDKQ
jgi:hypothetical protein